MIPINNAPTVIPIYLTKLNTPNTFPFICSNLLEIIVDSKAGTIPTQVPNINIITDNIITFDSFNHPNNNVNIANPVIVTRSIIISLYFFDNHL